MTIGTVSDDETFEQIKKQLNRMVEVIKVIDFTNMFVRMKEILYIKVLTALLRTRLNYSRLLRLLRPESLITVKTACFWNSYRQRPKNDAVVKLIKEEFGRIEVVRGGSVGIESISMMER